MRGSPTARLLAVVSLTALLTPAVQVCRPARATERVAHGGEDPNRWKRLGSFRGSARSDLAQEAANFLFEVEQEGDLYEDLGKLTLGLGASPGDFKIKWDNAFSRQVQPLHEALPLGSDLTAKDLSRYYDIQSAVSRFRAIYVIPQGVTGDFGVGVKAEKGWELTLARARQPLVWGERSIQEVLDERNSDDFRELIERPPFQERDLLELTSQGIAGLAREIGQGLSPTADTEVGKIFYENIADPVTLLTDVGIPLPLEMFLEGDPRLSPGDRARLTTFVSLAPLSGGVGEFGLLFGYEIFSRFYRETTIVKEPDNKVLVSVRHVMHRGQELTPLKIRPEVRLLGFITLGYTFLEQRFDTGRTGSSGLVYRIDLNKPQGREALEALLGEGTDVRLHPLRVAAEQREGAELLGEEQRRGRRLLRLLRISLFSPFRYGDRKTVFQDRVKVGDLEFDEIGVARLRELRKKIGRERDWKKQFLVASQGNLLREDQEQAGLTGEGAFAVNLMTGYRNTKADAAEVRRQVTNLQHSLGPHPLFDELAALDGTGDTTYFASLRVSLGAEHVLYLEQVEDREVWVELAEILLGSEHADAWATPDARALWKRRKHRRSYRESIGEELDLLPQPTRRRLGVKDRFRLARRAFKNFTRLQELVRTGDCMSCLSKSFERERHVVLLQMLCYRLISDSGVAEPGYDLEIFGGPMLSPVNITNGIYYDFSTVRPRLDELTVEQRDWETAPEKAERLIAGSQAVWGGAKNLVRESDARLRAADLYLNVDPEAPEDAPVWKLRIFSDLRFAPELALRIDLRRSKLITADPTQATFLVPFGEPAGIIETPFATARFFYDMALPPTEELEEGTSYTLLVRVLNPDGRPVSEEQQLRFRWPNRDELPASPAGR